MLEFINNKDNITRETYKLAEDLLEKEIKSYLSKLETVFLDLELLSSIQHNIASVKYQKNMDNVPTVLKSLDQQDINSVIKFIGLLREHVGLNITYATLYFFPRHITFLSSVINTVANDTDRKEYNIALETLKQKTQLFIKDNNVKIVDLSDPISQEDLEKAIEEKIKEYHVHIAHMILQKEGIKIKMDPKDKDQIPACKEV